MSTAVAAPVRTTAPMPEEVDRRAAEFNNLAKSLLAARATVREASVPVEKMQDELIELVREFGGPHAQKSKILHGVLWEIMATFGQSITQDAAAVERLRLALVKNKQARVLRKLFQKDVRWTFRADAVEIVKAAKLSPKLMGLLLLCFVPRDRAPTLDVRLKKTGVNG